MIEQTRSLRGTVMDVYGSLLRNVMFPAFEELRQRPTVGLLHMLERTQWASPGELEAIQSGFVRRLARHAYAHTQHYREEWDRLGVDPWQLDAKTIALLPLLERADALDSLDTRLATAPPQVAIVKQTSGSTGQPMTVKYNAESRHWRDADRWRGYGWAGYRVGDRAIHYWGQGPMVPTRKAQLRATLDRALKRDLYVDSGRSDDASLDETVLAIRRFRPKVLVVFAQAAVRLAHHIIERGLRTWDPIPVLCGAEKVWPTDRATLAAAFGPVFETYGCREFQLIGTECEAHDGLHLSVEKLVVELIVRDAAASGGSRPAAPGEVGEIVVTDLHNLAHPLIRYVTGDLATAMEPTICACGRTLPRISSVQGRVADVLYDGSGNQVGGIVFSVLMTPLSEQVRHFQVVQHADRSLVLRVVPKPGGWPATAEITTRQFVAKYLPGIPLTIKVVDDIPMTSSGKRRLVIQEG